MPDTQITDEMVRVARDAFNKCRPVERVACQDFGMQQNDILEQQLKAALEAALAGHVVVPREPTIAQHIAAMEFALDHMAEYGVTGLSPFKDYPPLRETTAGMYRAMIQAAPPVPVEPKP